MFKDPQDEDFFVPKTQYYHVIERYYPVTYVAEMGWAICSNPMSEFYMCNAYTPVGVRATSARVTWLESVDEFGEVIQSVVKFSYDGKDDIFTAFANGYATFYPAQYGKDEISFDNLPEDFFHNIIMEHFENIDLGDCVKSYNENVIYLDLLPYYETHNYGTRLTGDNIYFRYGVQLPEVCNLAVNYGTNSIMQEQFEELDKDGIYEKEEEYFFCVDDVYTGSTYWSGTFKEKITGYSTVSLVKNPDYELPEPPTKTQSTGTNTENNSGIKGELAEGKEVTFGHYEQDGNVQNGKEDIVWEVIKTEDGKALLLSKYILDCHSYNDVCMSAEKEQMPQSLYGITE